MILTHKSICEGDLIPRFYGIAYRDILHDVTICYPFPFNIVIQYWRKWWMAIRYYRKENPLEAQALATTATEWRESMNLARKEAYDQGSLDMYNVLRKEAGLDEISELRKEKQ